MEHCVEAGDTLIYLLASGELELGSTQSLNHMLLVLGLGTHRHDHLTDVHTGHGALGFTESTTHSSLEPGRRERETYDYESCIKQHSNNFFKILRH